MSAVSASLIHELQPKILERRSRLQAAAHAISAEYLQELLAEIDTTLQKIDDGSYGLCERCHDPIEPDRLERNPLERFCLDHLTPEQLLAHQQDLELATEIQTRLLPARDITAGSWQTHYRYEPAGVVGGDYCEIVPARDGQSLFFAVGDVAGKGVAASLLMTHLTAIFRSLLSLDLPLRELMQRANRLFCESTPSTHYATMAAARTNGNGLDLCNAGHCRPLVLRRDGAEQIDPTGLPLGLFPEGRYTTRHISLDPGDTLVLYSDGITEAPGAEGDTYDEDRLMQALCAHADCDVQAAAGEVLRDVIRFRGPRPQQDDMTLLIARRRC